MKSWNFYSPIINNVLWCFEDVEIEKVILYFFHVKRFYQKLLSENIVSIYRPSNIHIANIDRGVDHVYLRLAMFREIFSKREEAGGFFET